MAKVRILDRETLLVQIVELLTNNIRRGQVDPEPTRPCTEQEAKLARPIFVELIDLRITLFSLCVPINPAVFILQIPHVILQNIKHARHLAKYEDTTASALEFGQKFVEYLHLSRVFPEMWSIRIGWPGFSAVEQVWVIADLFELHHDV